ncbi:MAG: acyltransferase [Pseudomonadales bacterium]|nr:acyltransferase [Pseudomonadales bacterium]
MGRIKIFDALRGYFVLWVIAAHLGELVHLRRIFDVDLLYNGYIAVTIFFLLSGFVITALIENKRESYGLFLFRRYFRIIPILILLSLVYLLQTDFILSVLQQLDTTREEITSRQEIYHSSKDYWWQHMLLHISLLYGLFEEIIPHAGKGFIPPNWSVTIEWQFYLLVPFMVAAFRKRKLLWVFFAILAITLLKEMLGIQGTFVGKHIFAFVVGIASYYAMNSEHSGLENIKSHAYIVMITTITTLLALTLAMKMPAEVVFGLLFPYAVWLSFLTMHYHVGDNGAKRLFLKIFENKAVLLLGEISYSVYLIHMLVIYNVLNLTLPWFTNSNIASFYLGNLVLIWAISIFISYFTYKYVEYPAMKWSAKVAKNWKTKRSAIQTYNTNE